MKSFETIDITNEKKKRDFEPSLKTISHIMKSMTSNRTEGKTCLARDTNLNYSRLAKHIVWLETKGLVESTIDKSKINVGLTAKGKVFASTLSNE